MRDEVGWRGAGRQGGGRRTLRAARGRGARRRGFAGFTLIELLVVISIIALLVGILLPALGAARKSAMGMKCAANQKQMGTAWFAYATDHEGRAVGSYQSYFAKKLPTKHWFVDLYPYYSDSIEILQCPIAPEPNPQYTSVTVPPGTMMPGSAEYAWYENNLFSLPLNFGGYGYNNWLEDVVPNSARSIMNSRGVDPDACRLDRGIDALVKTTQTPLFGDCTWADIGWATEPTPLPKNFKDPHVGPPQYLQRMCVDRHGEAINVNFLDGSTRRVAILDLWSLKWHAKWDATKPPGL